MVLVVIALVVILLGNYRDFSALVASRSAMSQKQEETQRLSDANDRLANVDELTGLPNRRSFQRRLTEMLAEATAQGKTIAVARLNLDSFKSVNDIFGRSPVTWCWQMSPAASMRCAGPRRSWPAWGQTTLP
jgi:predicted signal transduction protein with EAL and GGDEF domain